MYRLLKCSVVIIDPHIILTIFSTHILIKGAHLAMDLLLSFTALQNVLSSLT